MTGEELVVSAVFVSNNIQRGTYVNVWRAVGNFELQNADKAADKTDLVEDDGMKGLFTLEDKLRAIWPLRLSYRLAWLMSRSLFMTFFSFAHVQLL